jgi:hypothetical protein
MKIRTFKKLDNDVYRVSIYTEDWSEGDTLLMQKFGEPEIDLGGDFGGSPVLFTLDNDLKRIKTDSPFAAAFDARDYGATDAKAFANVWALELSDRIAAAVATLRMAVDGFTTEQVEEI